MVVSWWLVTLLIVFKKHSLCKNTIFNGNAVAVYALFYPFLFLLRFLDGGIQR